MKRGSGGEGRSTDDLALGRKEGDESKGHGKKKSGEKDDEEDDDDDDDDDSELPAMAGRQRLGGIGALGEGAKLNFKNAPKLQPGETHRSFTKRVNEWTEANMKQVRQKTSTQNAKDKKRKAREAKLDALKSKVFGEKLPAAGPGLAGMRDNKLGQAAGSKVAELEAYTSKVKDAYAAMKKKRKAAKDF